MLLDNVAFVRCRAAKAFIPIDSLSVFIWYIFHWLPITLRKIYAKIFNRLDREFDNLFWSPRKLGKALRNFQRTSTFAHYSTYKKYLDTFPFYNPYGSFKHEFRLSLAKKIYFRLLPKTRKLGNYFTPNLASVFKRIK